MAEPSFPVDTLCVLPQDFASMTETKFILRYKGCEPWQTLGRQLWRMHSFRRELRDIFSVKDGETSVTSLRLLEDRSRCLPRAAHVTATACVGTKRKHDGGAHDSNAQKKTRACGTQCDVGGGDDIGGGDGDGGDLPPLFTWRSLRSLTDDGASTRPFQPRTVLSLMHSMKMFMSFEGLSGDPVEGIPSVPGKFIMLSGHNKVLAYLTLFGDTLGSNVRIATVTNRFSKRK